MKKIFTCEQHRDLPTDKRILYTDSYLVKYRMKDKRGFTYSKTMILITNGKGAFKNIEQFFKRTFPGCKLDSIIYQ